jgi:hypothetical protein
MVPSKQSCRAARRDRRPDLTADSDAAGLLGSAMRPLETHFVRLVSTPFFIEETQVACGVKALVAVERHVVQTQELVARGTQRLRGNGYDRLHGDLFGYRRGADARDAEHYVLVMRARAEDRF